MTLGWSDAGQGGLRATNDDRRAVLRLLEIAEDEGRLDPVEQARRTDAVWAATWRRDLVALTADLPDRRGVTGWIEPARVRGDDRERAARWLAEGAARGRLDTAEFDRRLATLAVVDTYASLKPLLQGLPGWPEATDDLLATDDDRREALARLGEALTDGRIAPGDAGTWEAEVARARWLTDVRALLARLDARVSDTERRAAIEQLEQAYGDGRLDPQEHAARLALTGEATTDADLAELLRDLHGAGRRLTGVERGDLATRLKRALDEGRLGLTEYESRLRAAYASPTIAQAARLLADVTDPPKPPWRGPLDAAFDRFVLNSALLPEPTRWWQRLYPKLAWKALVVGTLLLPWTALVGLALYLGGPRGLGVLGAAVAVGWAPTAGLFLLYGWLAQIKVRDIVAGRQEATIATLGAALTRGRGEATVEYTGEVATIVGSADRDEAVRLCWSSRLRPLTRIEFRTEPWSVPHHTVRLDRAERARLRRLYGPRPYGPLPEDIEDAHGRVPGTPT